MLQEEILSNVVKLPEFYQKEILDFSDFLLSKLKKGNNTKHHSRCGFGARKGDYIMSKDFDKPLDDFLEYMK